MARLLWIGFGGFLGTIARYLMIGWALKLFGPAFPWGTLAVNVIGSFLLGVVMWIGVNTAAMSQTARLAITAGGMGGFTTYSTFNYETLQLFQQRAWLLGAANVGATLVGCLVAGILGWAGAAALLGR